MYSPPAKKRARCAKEIKKRNCYRERDMGIQAIEKRKMGDKEMNRTEEIKCREEES